jgi:protease-4
MNIHDHTDDNVPPKIDLHQFSQQKAESMGSRLFKRSIWKWVLAILVLLLLSMTILITVIFNYGSKIIFSESKPSLVPEFSETIIRDADTRNKILLLELKGLITDSLISGTRLDLVSLIKEQLRAAEYDDDVKAVVFYVDSPGGEAMAADAICRAIMEFQDKTGKPVIASMGSLAASGGYYVCAGCRWIVANELTLTGSIGVILHGWNYRGLLDKIGVRPEVYKSGKFKDMLRGDKAPDEVTPEERKMVQELVDEVFLKFKEMVKTGRQTSSSMNGKLGRKLAANWEEFADGRVFSGKKAYELGFVDELGDLETAFIRAKNLAKIGKAKVISYEKRISLVNILRFFSENEVLGLKIDTGLRIPNLKPGKIYLIPPEFFY